MSYETDFAERCERLQAAVGSGDGIAVVREQRAIDDADPAEVSALLADLETALRENQDSTARTLLGRLEGAYAEMDGAQSVRTTRTRAALRRVPSDSSAAQELNGYLRSQGQAETARGTLFVTVGAFLTDREDTPTRREAIRAVQRAEAAERTLTRRGERIDAAELRTAVDLPPSLSVVEATLDSATIATEERTQVTIGVQNVGNDPAEGVSVDLSLPDGLEAPSLEDIGTLESGETGRVSTPVGATDPGGYTVSANVAAENASPTTRTLVLTVTETRGPVERADKNDDGVISTDELRIAVGDWAEGIYSTSELNDIVAAWAEG